MKGVINVVKYLILGLLVLTIIGVLLLCRKHKNRKRIESVHYLNNVLHLEKNVADYREFVKKIMFEDKIDHDFYNESYVKKFKQKYVNIGYIKKIDEGLLFSIHRKDKSNGNYFAYRYFYAYDVLSVGNMIHHELLIVKKITKNWYMVQYPRRCKFLLERGKVCYDQYE